MENTKSYKTMQDMVINTYKTKGIYDIEMQDMADLYKGIDTDLNVEYTNDKIGELFESDKDFVKNLSVEQPGIFQTIKKEVQHLFKMAVPGSSQVKYLEGIKYNVEKAYREAKGNKNSNTNKNNVKFSVGYTTNNKVPYAIIEGKLDGLTRKEKIAEVTRILNNMNGKTITTVDGDRLTIVGNANGEQYTTTGKIVDIPPSKRNKSYYERKLPIASQLDEVAENSFYKGTRKETGDKSHSEHIDSEKWKYRTAFVKIGDDFFKLDLSIADNVWERNNINQIYNIPEKHIKRVSEEYIDNYKNRNISPYNKAEPNSRTAEPDVSTKSIPPFPTKNNKSDIDTPIFQDKSQYFEEFEYTAKRSKFNI